MVLVFANFSMLNPCYILAGWLDQVVVVVVATPEYMAGMMQQFELNRQFMENIMAQFPRPNMNQQPTQVTLQDFMRLNPTEYRSSTQPLDADDWLRDITIELRVPSERRKQR